MPFVMLAYLTEAYMYCIDYAITCNFIRYDVCTYVSVLHVLSDSH